MIARFAGISAEPLPPVCPWAHHVGPPEAAAADATSSSGFECDVSRIACTSPRAANPRRAARGTVAVTVRVVPVMIRPPARTMARCSGPCKRPVRRSTLSIARSARVRRRSWPRAYHATYGGRACRSQTRSAGPGAGAVADRSRYAFAKTPLPPRTRKVTRTRPPRATTSPLGSPSGIERCGAAPMLLRAAVPCGFAEVAAVPVVTASAASVIAKDVASGRSPAIPAVHRRKMRAGLCVTAAHRRSGYPRSGRTSLPPAFSAAGLNPSR